MIESGVYEDIYASLALDDINQPIVSYYDGYPSTRDLRFAHKTDSGWHMEIVDDEGWVGLYTSLGMDDAGLPHISYYDWENYSLKYAYLAGPGSVVLSGDLESGGLVLHWSEAFGVSEYWVYGASDVVFFEPGLLPPYDSRLDVLPSDSTTWSSPSGIYDPEHNWTYLVVAVDEVEAELARSNRIGEHDFEEEIP